MKRILSLVFLALPLLAQQETPRPPLSEYERLLIPVYAPSGVAGANGARWQATLWLRNDGETVDAFPLPNTCFTSFICSVTMRSFPALPGPFTAINDPAGVPHGPWAIRSAGLHGGFLFVERRGIDGLGMQLHVADVTRDATPARLPVVRESEFFTSARTIPGVPLQDGSRVTLRVYDLDSRPVSQVRVRITRQFLGFTLPPPPRTVAEEVFTLTHDAANDSCGFLFGCPKDVFYQPGYAEIASLGDVYPARELVEVTIEPLTEGLRYWPMITVTNDETNDISLHTVR